MTVNYPRRSGKISLSPTPPELGASPDLELVPCPDAKVARKVQRREQAEQIAYFDRVRKCLRVDPATGIANPFPAREGAERIFGLANENAAGKGVGVLRWKMGVKAGLPDIGVFVPRHGFHAAFIELKTSGGVMSDVRKDQRQFQEEANRFGYKSVICFGWYEAWKFTYDYLGWSEY